MNTQGYLNRQWQAGRIVRLNSGHFQPSRWTWRMGACTSQRTNQAGPELVAERLPQKMCQRIGSTDFLPEPPCIISYIYIYIYTYIYLSISLPYISIYFIGTKILLSLWRFSHPTLERQRPGDSDPSAEARQAKERRAQEEEALKAPGGSGRIPRRIWAPADGGIDISGHLEIVTIQQRIIDNGQINRNKK